MGPLFLAMNRNKRSIALDLKTPEGGAARCSTSRATPTCWPTTCGPQAMQRLGLDYESLAAINPRLIYAGMFGFSQRGRYAASAAFDDLIQAACALPHANGQSQRRHSALLADHHRRPLGRPVCLRRDLGRAVWPRTHRPRPTHRHPDVRVDGAAGARRPSVRPHLRTARRGISATRGCCRRSAGPTARATATSAA